MKTTVVTADGTFACNTAPVQGDLETIFRRAAAIGFDGVQLTVEDAATVDVDQVRELTVRYGLEVSAIATGRIYSHAGHSFGDEDEAGRSEAVRMMKAHVDLAKALGGSTYVIVGAVRGEYRNASTPEIYYARFHKSMDELMAYAEAEEITVIMEATDATESEAYCGVLETADYIRSFNSQYLGLQLDTMHMRRAGQDIALIPQVADVLVQVDISGEARRNPAEDDFDYDGLMGILERIDYRGWLTFEHMGDPAAGIDRVLHRG